jgi:hypothetical protein
MWIDATILAKLIEESALQAEMVQFVPEFQEYLCVLLRLQLWPIQ